MKNNRRHFLKSLPFIGLMGYFGPKLIEKKKTSRNRILCGGEPVYVGPIKIYGYVEEGYCVIDKRAICKINI